MCLGLAGVVLVSFRECSHSSSKDTRAFQMFGKASWPLTHTQSTAALAGQCGWAVWALVITLLWSCMMSLCGASEAPSQSSAQSLPNPFSLLALWGDLWGSSFSWEQNQSRLSLLGINNRGLVSKPKRVVDKLAINPVWLLSSSKCALIPNKYKAVSRAVCGAWLSSLPWSPLPAASPPQYGSVCAFVVREESSTLKHLLNAVSGTAGWEKA